MNTTQPFQLGECLVVPDKNQLVGQDGVINLEPRAMEVLCYMAAKQSVVSIDELISNLWHGRVVGNHAVYRIFHQLRSALKAAGNDGDTVVNIPKRGYQLCLPLQSPAQNGPNHDSPVLGLQGTEANDATAQASAVASPASDNTSSLSAEVSDCRLADEPRAETRPSSRVFHRKKNWMAISAVVLATLTIAACYWLLSTPEFIQYADARAFTTNSGIEDDPAFSPDGKWVVFSHRTTSRSYRQLHLQAVDGNISYPLTEGSFDAAHATWSPDGKQLAFFQTTDNACQIKVARLDTSTYQLSQERAFYDCGKLDEHAALIWVDLDNVLYVNTSSPLAPSYLSLIDINTGRELPLTRPEQGQSRGDYAPAKHPFEAKIAFLRDENWGNSQLMLLDLKDKSVTRLADLNGWVPSVTWDHQGENLLYIAGGNKVYAYHLSAQKEQLVAYNATTISSPTHSPREPRLLVTSGQGELNIASRKLSPPSSEEQSPAEQLLISSSRIEFIPEYAHNSNVLAFMSERTHAPQVWLREDDGSLRQLTHFSDRRTIRRLRWSHDDTQLVSHFDGELYLIDVETGATRAVTLPEDINAETAAFSLDNQSLFFSSDISGDWQIYRLQLANNEVEQITEFGGYSAQEAADGFLYYLKFHLPGLWRQPSDGKGREELVIEDIDVYSNNGWRVRPEGIYYFSNEPSKAGISFFDFESKETKQLIPLHPAIRHFTLNPQATWAAFPVLAEWKADLYQLQPAFTR